MTSTDLIELPEIVAAAGRIREHVLRTPLLRTQFSRAQEPLFLKAECLQVSGSFKVRGAFNAVAQLSDADRARGVVTHSSGNHAQALARAARAAGLAATIVMPHQTPAVKRLATQAQGATVVLVDAADRASTVARIQAETGAVFVPPFDDRAIIAGQGTMGIEIADDLPNVSTVFVPVGGGGMISGIAAAVKARIPGVRVIGVEPALAGDLAEGFSAGTRTIWDVVLTGRTIADGLRGQGVGTLNWQHITALVDEVLTVSEEDILAAMRDIVLEGKLVCEPSGAVAAAGYLSDPARWGAGPAVAVVSGGNVDPALLCEVIKSVG